jgi:hypothetical protein
MNFSATCAQGTAGFVQQVCPVTRQVAPNSISSFDGFHISYCRESSSYGSDTTALVLQGTVFFILKGNYSQAMLRAAHEKGVQGCIDVFIEQLDRVSSFSEHLMALELIKDQFGLAKYARQTLGEQCFDRLREAVNRQLGSQQESSVQVQV